MKKTNFFVVLFCLIHCVVSAQTAVIENIGGKEKNYEYKIFEIKSIKNSKITPQQLKTLNQKIKTDIFSAMDMDGKETSVAQMSLKQIIDYFVNHAKKEVKEKGYLMGLTNIDYEIILNDKGILSFINKNEFIAAHPTTNMEYFCFDLKTGKKIESNQKQEDIFSSPKQKQVFMQGLKTKIEARGKEKMKELDAETTPELSERIKSISLENVTFMITPKGIDYIYSYDLPHVMQAIEPEITYSFSWQELDKFVKKDGVLAPFYKK